MLNMCVESELDIVGNTLLEGWMDGWMDGWVGGSQSRVKDCLQQSKSRVKDCLQQSKRKC